jgi:hypothetical protein
MRRRARRGLIASLVVLLLPWWVAAQQPITPEDAHAPPPRTAVEPDRTDAVDPPGPDGQPKEDRAPSNEGTDGTAREGAGGMEPRPDPRRGDEVKPDKEDEQHRAWLESIWNSP